MWRQGKWRVSLCLVGLLLGACDGVTFVERIVVVNDTAYATYVDVRGQSGGWLGLAPAPAGASTDVRKVIDQGESWEFRFSYGTHDPVVVEVSRSELVDADWRVEVPAELEESLRDAGVPPPP